jgi:CelD/BcsL family acetyltransferase involved in cellulose biosynthesis
VFGGGSQAVNGAGLKIRAVREPVPQARRAEGFVGSNPTPRTSETMTSARRKRNYISCT